MTGDQLYDELRAAADAAGVSLAQFARPLWPNASAKNLDSLRISRHVQGHTIERIRALIEGRPIPDAPPRRKGQYSPDLQGMRRVDRERQGLPPSNRAVMEAELASRATARRERVGLTRRLVDIAHSQRKPGQTIADAVRELRRAAR